MNAKFYLLALPLLPLIALAKNVPNVHQQHTQQLDVHQHGFGILSLALNEQQLVLELLTLISSQPTQVTWLQSACG